MSEPEWRPLSVDLSGERLQQICDRTSVDLGTQFHVARAFNIVSPFDAVRILTRRTRGEALLIAQELADREAASSKRHHSKIKSDVLVDRLFHHTLHPTGHPPSDANKFYWIRLSNRNQPGVIGKTMYWGKGKSGKDGWYFKESMATGMMGGAALDKAIANRLELDLIEVGVITKFIGYTRTGKQRTTRIWAPIKTKKVVDSK